MTNANTLELAMLDLINKERADAGLEELRLITLLNSAAENHSSWMLEADKFSHEGEGGSSPSDRMEAAGYPFEGNSLALENIGWQSARGAEGYEDDVAQVHEGLMASPGHRANILNPDAKDIGIGIEIGTFSGAGGDYEAVMVTQVFGTTEADLSAFIDPGTGADDGDDVVVPDDDMTDDDMVVDETPDTEDDMTGDEVVCEVDETEETDEDVAEDDDVIEVVDGTEDDAEEPIEDSDGETSDEAEDDSDEDMSEDDEAEDDDMSEDETEDEAEDDDSDDSDDDSNDDTSDDDIADDPTALPPLPCGLTDFHVDLREAFEFRQEGDQLIWETSEERLTEVFLKAFEDWTAGEEVETVDDETGIEDLMMEDEVSNADWAGDDEDLEDDWMFGHCG